MTKAISIKFYSDAGHGWAKVHKEFLAKLGIENKITSYSYERGDYAYLEEDCDVSTLVKAAEANDYKIMLMKTAELTGAALDWAVAKCEGIINGDDLDIGFILERGYTPSTDWAQGGPIIERENLGVWWDGVWHAKYDGCRPDQVQDAGTPLIAAMRCYVANKLGNIVDVPSELTN